MSLFFVLSPHPYFNIHILFYYYSLYSVYIYARRRIMRAGARENFA